MTTLLTALEVANQEFRRELRGYHRGDVDDFLDRVAETLQQYAELVQEHERRWRASEDELREYATQKEALQRALLLAEQTSREIGEKAEREREALVAEAREQAEKILAEAREEAQGAVVRLRQGEEDAARQLERLVCLRRQAVAETRELLSKLGMVLDAQEKIARSSEAAWAISPEACRPDPADPS